MKRILILSSLIIAFTACKNEKDTDTAAVAETAAETPKTDNTMTFDKAALDDKMIATDGTETTFRQVLEQYKGKTVVVDVWASWCPDCVKGMPKVKALQEKFPEVTYLFLSYDKTPESWKEGIAKNNVVGEHYLIGSAWKGGTFSEAIKLDWIPRYMVLDTEGNVALFKAIEADDEQLIATLNTL